MRQKLDDSETTIIQRVERGLSFWRYARWIQLAAGLSLVVYSITLTESSSSPSLPFVFGIAHPFLATAIGSALAGEAIFDRSAKERRLLLKLHRTAEADAA